MRLKTVILTAVLASLPTSVFGQAGEFDDVIGSFSGMADQVRSANPVLAATQGGSGAGSSIGGGLGISSLFGKKNAKFTGYGTGQGLRLSVQQQQALEKRKRELDLAAKRKTLRPGAKTAAGPAAPNPLAPAAALAASMAKAPQPDGSAAPSGPSPGLLGAPSKKLEIRLVSSAKLGEVGKGLDRDAVLARLGAPSFTSAVTGLEEGYRETLAYHLDPENIVTVRLLDGKVQDIR